MNRHYLAWAVLVCAACSPTKNVGGASADVGNDAAGEIAGADADAANQDAGADAGAQDVADVADVAVAQDVGADVEDVAPGQDAAAEIASQDSAGTDAASGPEVADGKDSSDGKDSTASKDISVGDGQCTTEQACKSSSGLCKSPGAPFGCGMCKPGESTCQASADCESGDVCKPVQCSCNGASACQPGCKVDADCDQGFAAQVCGADGECKVMPCQTVKQDGDCPTDFTCLVPTVGSPGCFRKGCNASAQCQGVCVNGQCYDTPGQCSFPPP